MKDKCQFCGQSEFTQKSVQYIYRRDGHFFVVNNVPCEECNSCGERYYAAKNLKRIEAEFEALERGEKTARQEVTVPVEEFAEFAL
ncbi:YgiT-type zinc finger domain-containing protein [Alkalispirochaeta americana]|uniref:YgiT-type zinc finger domain-containing protein n=1 Tax=Alkalispirochaeta americana TaxID=159291 RepID=A0A1N6Q4A2_9SPIO|nr:type II toxin-antitoxin system MqsA family antitoxin [Alkalispirochaeta americana]SIQ11418.1 YgiT-type zinc finger domain-containing protein [Alkalispirochaeta americana]